MNAGPLALVGGGELEPGNEPQDEVLVEAAAGGPAFVLATAAAEQRPDLAVRHATEWFARLGLHVEELPATSREMAESPEVAEVARRGRFFYLVGGDPRLVPAVLSGSAVWSAMLEAWNEGAALAGSSAGAMAMAERVLLPGDGRLAIADGLGLVPGVAVIPHLDTFGAGWTEQVPSAGRPTLLGLDERTAAVWHEGRWGALGEGAVTVLSGKDPQRFSEGGTITGLPEPRSA